MKLSNPFSFFREINKKIHQLNDTLNIGRLYNHNKRFISSDMKNC